MYSKRIILCLACVLMLCASAGADVVTDWNSISIDAIRTAGLTSVPAARALAMVHGAVYDAVNSIALTHSEYLVTVPALPGSSPETAAIAAAHRVLVGLFPAQVAVLDGEFANSLAGFPAGDSTTNGIAVGEATATEMLAWRMTDHSMDMVMYSPPVGPGYWKPTPPAFMMAMMPQWPNVTPFAMQSGSQFRLPPPPSLESPFYSTNFSEVAAIGAKSTRLRNAYDTQTAMFWADSPGTVTTVGRWNLAAQQVAAARRTGLFQNARLFALLNITLADAGIAAWDSKYYYSFWRPITAIREAEADGNRRTRLRPDPLWEPLLMTPAFPEYPSAHSTFSGAAAQILNRWFSGRVGFAFDSYSAPTTTRRYGSFWDAAEEAGMSRIFGGIHFSFSNTRGLHMGRRLADYVLGNFLRPI